MIKNDELFVICASGLEPLLVQELNELGFDQAIPGFRGVYVKGNSLEDICRINYNSRLASRVLLPLQRFICRGRQSLYDAVYDIDWVKYIPTDATIAIDANVSNRDFRNSLYAAQLTKDAICDQLRERRNERPNVDTSNPDVQLNLFIHDSKGVISFDTSGSPLHKRGYRQVSTEAPIRETLAAALLRLAKYSPEEIFCDPCCGSGTLLIEAALIASKTAPGFLRNKWGFMTLPQFNQQTWLKVKAEADLKRTPLVKGHFWGLDINKNAVHTAKANLRAAGFHQAVEIAQGDFRDFPLSLQPNFVLTNPPHGKRLGEVEQLIGLYRSLGDFLKQKTTKPGKGFIFVGSPELAKEVGLAPKRRHEVDNAGIDSRLLEFDLY